jgi:2-polyprenyl-6-methoxyphenol hydroxylase-like FAD-dependent oxidoreductase
MRSAGDRPVPSSAALNERRIPVLIAGAGPVGLALAIELGRAGVECVVIEERDGQITIPKMATLTSRSMEFNRRWGIAEALRKIGWPATLSQDFVYCTSLVGYELGRRTIPAHVDHRLSYTPEPRASCAQIFYHPILLAKAQSFPRVAIRHGTRLESFTQNEDCVCAAIIDQVTGNRETIVARYLVGCDGADGTVVTSLGFGYDGFGRLANSVNVYFRSPELMSIHDKGWARFFRFTDARGTWAELIGIDGKELWRLSVLEADPDFDGPGYIRRLAGVEVPFEILSYMEWERRERVAQRYRDRRVFICGDAAHQNSPTGALGFHTGLADAVDLGWKLIATLQGWGGKGLLDSYEAERRPIALLNLRASSDQFRLLAGLPGGRQIAENCATGAAQRQQWAEAYRRTNGANSPIYSDNLLLGYCYEGSPICESDGSPAIPLETPEFVPSGRPGTRAPHAWLSETKSTLDLFGKGFVLLRLGPNAPKSDALIEAAAARRLPLDVCDIAEREIASLYQKSLVLVRPDGHVAWRSDAVPSDSVALLDRLRGEFV